MGESLRTPAALSVLLPQQLLADPVNRHPPECLLVLNVKQAAIRPQLNQHHALNALPENTHPPLVRQPV